jgi:hypothetical protein
MLPPIDETRTALAGCLATLVALCGLGSPAQLVAQTVDEHTGKQLDPVRLSAAIDSAAAYLLRSCDDDGRFTYRVDLNPSIQPEPRYNILRHAGAIYALAQYHERHPDDGTRKVLLRAGSFLKEAIGPVAGNPHLLAVWSLPENNGTDAPRQAKLGGSGLGLAALLSLERIEPGFCTIDDLRRLGRFILFMQKADGSFYSKYYPDAGGRNDQWTSMYYPGEAALGLLMLYDRDPQPQWLGGAAKALDDLARTGGQRPKTLPDQWVLLATERLLPHYRTKSVLVPRDALLQHARRTCRDMLEDQRGQENTPSIRGCYTDDGRTCPSATRLEGLLAALRFLPPAEEPLRKQLRRSVDAGMLFLVNNQLTEGPYAGGLPRVALGFSAPERGNAPVDLYPTEIRIDYVQHALSAMLAYQLERGGD